MLKDMGKKKIVNKVVKEARIITTFIYNHGYVLALMREVWRGYSVSRCDEVCHQYSPSKHYTKKVGLRATFSCKNGTNTMRVVM